MQCNSQTLFIGCWGTLSSVLCNFLFLHLTHNNIYVVVSFLSQVIFVFLLFLGMVMYANEIETKEK